MVPLFCRWRWCLGLMLLCVAGERAVAQEDLGAGSEVLSPSGETPAASPLPKEEMSPSSQENPDRAEGGFFSRLFATKSAGSSSHGVLARSLEAGPVVFLVLLLLIAFSILSWAIAVFKLWVLSGAVQRSQDFLQEFWNYASFNDLYEQHETFPSSPVKEVFLAGYNGLVKNVSQAPVEDSPILAVSLSMAGILRELKKARLASRKRLEEYLLFLAICASSAPFIGLFGTVWGIMNAFEKISLSGSTSLAVVAPGISEALVATAFGLIASIPAMIGYNICQNRIRRVMAHVDEFMADFQNIVERYLLSQFSSASEGGEAGPVAAAGVGRNEDQKEGLPQEHRVQPVAVPRH